MLNCFDGNSLITFLYIIFIVSTMLCKTELCGWVNQRLLPPGFCLGEAIGSYCRKVEENKVIMIISPLPSFLLRVFFFFGNYCISPPKLYYWWPSPVAVALSLSYGPVPPIAPQL